MRNVIEYQIKKGGTMTLDDSRFKVAEITRVPSGVVLFLYPIKHKKPANVKVDKRLFPKAEHKFL